MKTEVLKFITPNYQITNDSYGRNYDFEYNFTGPIPLFKDMYANINKDNVIIKIILI